jgi:predicted Zn-dependent protease
MLTTMAHSVLLRVVGVVVAVIVCAWFALGIRQAHDANRATDILAGASPLTSPQVHEAGSLLHRAGQLNPDRSVDLLRSQLALRQGDAARARAIALGVTRAEPENLDAWLAYGEASTHDRLAFLLALQHLNRLAPPVHHGG